MVVNGEGLILAVSISNSREFRSAGPGGSLKDGVRRKTSRRQNGSGYVSGEAGMLEFGMTAVFSQ
jgi:hypothetical protein